MNTLPKGFSARRSEIVPVLANAEIMPWGWLVTFHGTVAELIGSGVATPEMFTGLGKTGVKTSDDGFGNKYKVQRRPKDEFDLEYWLRDTYGDPLHPAARKLLAWKTYGAGCEAIVADVLVRMRADRKVKS